MKVLHIISTNALAGTERYLLDLVTHASADIEVQVVCPPNGPLIGALAERNISTVPLNFGVRHLPQTAFVLWRFLHSWKPDVVHTHLGKATLVGALTARLARVPVIVTTLHFIKPAYASTHSKFLYPFFLLGHQFINLCLTRLIAISEAVRTETLQREKVNPRKVVCIPHGTNFQAAILDETARGQLKSELNLNPDLPLVITVARLQKEKGHALLINAISRVLAEYQAEFLWIGDGSERPNLEYELEKAGLRRCVKLLGFRQDLSNLLALADIFVLPSPEEPFGIAVLEAMAANLPVIAINKGGPAEIVVNGETGLLTAYQPEALADAVNALLKDPVKAKKMGEVGKKRCATEYTLERMIHQTEQLYRDDLANDRKN